MESRQTRPGSTPGHPQSVTDLRVATLAGGAHLECISRVCTAIDVGERDWNSGSVPGAPHLLLIESSGLRAQPGGEGALADEKVERAAELVAWAERGGISTALWETALMRQIQTPTPLLRSVKHVFVVDPEAAEPLTEKLEGRRPMRLPLAAQTVPIDVPGYGDRSNQVAFVGGWPAGFKGRFKEELEAILDVAADHGLVIFRSERDGTSDALPDRFSSFVRSMSSAAEAVEAFADSRMVVGFDPANSGRSAVPQLSLDALAAGSVLVAPNHAGTRSMFRYTSLFAKDREEAKEAIGRVLGSEKEWSEMSEVGRRAILHAHTYSHRLATIASAAGFRVVPEALPKAAVT
jgi:Glycosyl transferases group 1